MEIKVDVKLKFKNGGDWNYDRLLLDYKFKLPNKFFSVRDCVIVTSVGWENTYATYEEFQMDTINKIQDRDYLESVVTKKVKEYIKNQKKYSRQDVNNETINSLLKGNNLQFLVKIKG